MAHEGVGGQSLPQLPYGLLRLNRVLVYVYVAGAVVVKLLHPAAPGRFAFVDAAQGLDDHLQPSLGIAHQPNFGTGVLASLHRIYVQVDDLGLLGHFVVIADGAVGEPGADGKYHVRLQERLAGAFPSVHA